jgi:hypothetical protein
MHGEGGHHNSLGPIVRPYTITGGRTRTSVEELELETLVATTSAGDLELPRLTMERREIAALCREILSVAEVSARVNVTLGVARVLVGDMAEEGLVEIHRPATANHSPDVALLERVLYGLRAL